MKLFILGTVLLLLSAASLADAQKYAPAFTCTPPPLRTATATAPDSSAIMPPAMWIHRMPFIGVLARLRSLKPLQPPAPRGETGAGRRVGSGVPRRSPRA